MAMESEGRIKIYIYILCVFILQLFSQTAYATSSSPVLAVKNAPGIGGTGGEASGSGTAMPNLFTGTMSYGIPIDVPAGRQGMQPNLSLTYRSNNGNGWVGMGWDLEVGAIERSAINGVNYDGDNFVLRIGGSTVDLVNIGTNQYRTKIEGAFYKIEKIISSSDNRPYWQVTDKTGKWYRFGYYAYNRQDDPGDTNLNKPVNPDHIFKWCLDHVEDKNGNYIDYTYAKQVNGHPYQGQIYLDRIDYTGNSLTNSSPTNYVKFYLEDRPDVPDMFSTNFKVTTMFRLKTIDVWGNGNRMRVYQLVYNQSSVSTGRSLLISFQQFGKDATLNQKSWAVTGGTALPAVTFGWQQGGSDYDGGTSLNFDANRDHRNLIVADVNGDGIADFIYQPDGSSSSLCAQFGLGTVGVFLGNGDGTFQPIKCSPGVEANRDFRNLLVADVDGDGKVDLIYQPDGSDTSACAHSLPGPAQLGIVGVYLGNGDGTFQNIKCTGFEANRDSRNLLVADVDGDGKADLIYQPDSSSTSACAPGYGLGIVGVYISTGDISSGPAMFKPIKCNPNVEANRDFRNLLVADVNGDGKADLIYQPDGSTTSACGAGKVGVYIGIGDGTFQNIKCTGFDANRNYRNLLVADINGDGRDDLVYQPDGSNTSACASIGLGIVGIYISTGDISTGPGMFEPIRCTGFEANRSFRNLLVADVNGDGRADLIYQPDSSGASTCAPVMGPGIVGVYIGNGDGTFQPIRCTGWEANRDFRNLLVADVNGDGQSDLIYQPDGSGTSTYGAGIVGVHKANQPAPDLMISISNGIGGSTSMKYVPSTQYQNTQLPFPIQTVKAVTVSDGIASNMTTTYDYFGGFFYINERDFRGFNYAKLTGPIGPNGAQKIIENWFHQGNDINIISAAVTTVDLRNLANVSTGYMKGKPYRTQVSDGNNAKYTESTIIHYAPDTIHNPYNYFAPPMQTDTYNCDGNTTGECANYSSAQHIQTVYAYDQYGNVTREDQYGDMADPNDDRTVVRSYAINATLWIVGLLANETIYQGTYPNTQVQNLDPEEAVSATTYYYDAAPNCNTASTNQNPTAGNITRIVRQIWPGDLIDTAEVRMAYNANGNLFCTRDSNGNRPSAISYDSTATFPTSLTNALLQSTITQYYAGLPSDTGLYGQVQSVTDPNGAVTTMNYDKLGRRSQTTFPDGAWTSWTYNAYGVPGSQNIQTDTAVGLSSWNYFDGLGRTIKNTKTGSGGRLISFQTQYNPTGTISQSTLPYFEGNTQQWTYFTYDPMGRPIHVQNPDGTVVSSCYDNGVTVLIDADQHRKREVKNAQGNLIEVDEYTGSFTNCTTDLQSPYATTTYQYDVLGNLEIVLDAEGNETEMYYDMLNHKYYMWDPDMGEFLYTYDNNGNLIEQDAYGIGTGRATTFAFDSLNRLIETDYSKGAINDWGNYGIAASYTYDETWSTNSVGRLTTMYDAGVTNYYYDNRGRVNETLNYIDALNYVMVNSYDLAGRIKSIQYPHPYPSQDVETVSYLYNADVLSVVTGTTATTTVNYVSYSNFNALGQPGTVTFGNGVNTTLQYNPSNYRLTSLSSSSPVNALLNLAYAYDNVGNVNSITDSINANRSQSFTYDDLNRLIQTQSTSYGGNGILAYFYYQIGNFQSKEGINYNYNWYPAHAVSHTSDGNSYTYDTYGNMKSDGVRTITYDYNNMPVSVVMSGATTTFVYDGMGNRVKKISPSGITTYIGKLYECSGGGTCVKNIYAGGTRIAHRIVGTSNIVWYDPDQLGSTRAVSDTSGNKIEDIQYLPFGKTNADTGTVSMSYKYTAQEFDAETGLYNYNARLYNPQLGRFISPDSIVPAPFNPQSLNRYSYVLNNPLKYTDPSGQRLNNPIEDALQKANNWLVRESSKLPSRLEREYKQNRDTIVAYHAHLMDPLIGGYFLQKTERGSDILAYEVTGATAVGCVFGYTCGMFIEEVSEGYNAHIHGRKLLTAVVKGAGKGIPLDLVGYYIGEPAGNVASKYLDWEWARYPLSLFGYNITIDFVETGTKEIINQIAEYIENEIYSGKNSNTSNLDVNLASHLNGFYSLDQWYKKNMSENSEPAICERPDKTFGPCIDMNR